MKIAACLIVKNEEADIIEWMAYHFAVGFDTLLIYNNASTDRTELLIKAAAEVKDVRWTPWPESLTRGQENAYTDACHRYGDEFDWIAFIDGDEFILPEEGLGISNFLERFGPEHDAIGLNWAMFGSSGHQTAPGGLIITNFVKRADTRFGPGHHIKSILRPNKLIEWINPHYALTQSNHYTDATGGTIEWHHPGLRKGEALLAPCRINHYFTRSRQHWQRRMDRGQRTNRTWEDFQNYDRNEVVDLEILRYLRPTLQELDEMYKSMATIIALGE